MNTLTDMFRKSSPAYGLYEKIHDDTGLKWLNRAYTATDSNLTYSASAEYYHRRHTIQSFEAFRVAYICFTLVSMACMVILFGLYAHNGIKKEYIWCGIVAFFVSSIIAVVMAMLYRILFNQFIELWLGKYWQTKDFYKDTILMMRTCYEGMEKDSLSDEKILTKVEWFRSTGNDISSVNIPGHVIQAGRTYLEDFALSIVKETDASDSGNIHQRLNSRAYADTQRAHLREVQRIYRKFRIIPQNDQLQNYYARAEETLRLKRLQQQPATQ